MFIYNFLCFYFLFYLFFLGAVGGGGFISILIHPSIFVIFIKLICFRVHALEFGNVILIGMLGHLLEGTYAHAKE